MLEEQSKNNTLESDSIDSLNSQSGKNNNFFGHKHSEETKAVISEKMKEIAANRDINKENNPFYGKEHTEEVKAYLSEINTGENHPKSIITKEIVLDIRAKHASGTYSRKELAKEFDLKSEHIKSIIQRKTWKHI